MSPNILDPRFKYLPAASHSDPQPFRERMKERMAAAQQKSKPAPVAQLTRSKK